MSYGATRSWLIALITSLFVAGAAFVALAAWATSSPQGASPDEDFHLSSIWCATGDTSLCRDSGQSTDEAGVAMKQVPRDVVGSTCYAFDSNKSARCLSDHTDWAVARVNDGLYPSGYYRVMSLFAGHDVADSVLRMRLLNAFLAVLLGGLALAVSLPKDRFAVAATWAAGLVPLGAFLVSSTNPSSWAVIGLGTLWAFLARLLQGGPVRGTVLAGVGAVASFVIAVSARSDALVLGGVTIAACLIAFAPLALRQLALRASLPVVLLLVAGVGYLGSTASRVASEGARTVGATGAPPHDGGFGMLVFNAYHLPDLLLGFVGAGWGLGWLDTPLPSIVPAVSVGALAVLLVLAVRGAGLRAWLASGLVVTAIVAMPLYLLQASAAYVGTQVQPRYLYPLLFAAVGILAVGAADRLVAPRRTVLLIGLAIGIANTYALHQNLQRYVVGLDDRVVLLDRAREWWWSSVPLGPDAVWLLGGLAGIVTFGAIALLVTRDVVREDVTPASPAP